MWWVVLVVFLGVCWVCSIIYEAYHETCVAPRKEMFICEKHGPMPKETTVKLLDGDWDQVTGDGIARRGEFRGCGLCYNDKIKAAMRGAK